MSFGRWIALAHAAAPAGPGALEARLGEGAQGLIEYPSGKSAMVYYDADHAEVSSALNRLKTVAKDSKDVFVRFSTESNATNGLARRLKAFEDRFGAKPLWNQSQ